MIADAGDDVYNASTEFSRAFAVSFQIIDDVLNFSRSEHWTKTCGEDLANGKPTYVIVRAINLLTSQDRDRLIEILCDPTLRHDPSSFETGVNLVYKSGALESCRDEAKTLTENAWKVFSDYLEPSEPKIMLNSMCKKLLDLAYDA